MGLFSKFIGGLQNNQNEHDDYFLDDGYNDDDGYQDDYNDYEVKDKSNIFSKKQQGSSASDKLSTFFNRKPDAAENDMQVVSIRPNSLSDFDEICNNLLNDTAVILNMDQLNRTDCQRLTDFTFGLIKGIDGNFQKISNDILLASPNTVDISGDFIGDLISEITKSQNSSSMSAFRNQPRTGSFYFNS